MARRRLSLRAIGLTLFFLYFAFIGGTFITEQRFYPRIIHHVIVTALLGGWVINLLVKRRAFPSTPLDFPVLAALAAYIIATIFAADPRVSMEGLWLACVHALMLYFVVDVMRALSPRMVLEPMYFTAGIVVFVGLAEFVSWYTGLPIIPIFGEGWWSIGGLQQPLPPGIHRLTVPLNVSTSLAAYLGMLIPVAAAWGFASSRKQTRQMVSLWVVGALVVLLLTLSRGGLLSLGTGIIVLVVLIVTGLPEIRRQLAAYFKDWRTWAAVGVVGLGLGGLLISVWSRRWMPGVRGGDSVRFDLWQAAWNIIRRFPITGVGPGGYGRFLREYRNPLITGDHLNSPHNVLLYIGSEAGVLGLLTFGSVVAAVVVVAVRRLRSADGPDRLRVAGVIAGLAGFSAQSMFDNFTSTPLVLPVIVLVAYLVEPYTRVGVPEKVDKKPGPAPLVVLAAIALSAAAWVVSDMAQYQFEQAIRTDASAEEALEAVERAQRVDPAMRLYGIQRAQILGRLADEDPAYLPDAIRAHEEVIEAGTTYDVFYANYAALLAQNGEYDAAFEVMSRAAAILPTEPEYRLWSAEYAELAGQDAAAKSLYEDVLLSQPGWVTSTYWQKTALRQEMHREAIERLGVDGYDLSDVNTACLSIRVEDVREPRELECEAYLLWQLDNDPNSALVSLTDAIAQYPEEVPLYQARAEVNAALGNYDQAEYDARVARFLGSGRGNYVLGLVAEERGEIDRAVDYYIKAGPIVTQITGWSFAVYGRPANIYLLPQLDAPRLNGYDVQSWLALVDLYGSEDRLDDIDAVVSFVEEIDPYFDLNLFMQASR